MRTRSSTYVKVSEFLARGPATTVEISDATGVPLKSVQNIIGALGTNRSPLIANYIKIVNKYQERTPEEPVVEVNLVESALRSRSELERVWSSL